MNDRPTPIPISTAIRTLTPNQQSSLAPADALWPLVRILTAIAARVTVEQERQRAETGQDGAT